MITPSLIIGAAPLLATSSKKSSSSSSDLSFLVIIVLFVAVYFFFLRPRQQRAKAQAGKGKTFGIGDEVMSVGGIFGRVVDLADESVDVEVAPGIVLTFLKRAVNPRPPSALSSTAPADIPTTDRDDLAHPYGGPTSDSTSFGASSGHFGEPGDDATEDTDANDGDFEDRDFEDRDFEDNDFEDYEDEGFEDEGDDDGTAVDQGPETSGNGQQHDQPGSSDGSPTGTPRATGGSRSEGD